MARGEGLPELQVLVIDDDEMILDIVSLALKKAGVSRIQLAASGEKALEIIADAGHQLDIILCDLQMPGMDGIEVIRHLANMAFNGGLILLSGEDQRILKTAETFAQVRGLNVLGALAKPADIAALGDLLQRYQPPAAQQAANAPPRVSPEELYAAISAGDVITYFQPKVDIKTRLVKGVETLARWRHPEKGMIPPGIFVGLAERYQLIDALTETVIVQALQQGIAWQRQGRDLQVAVNVSMDNLQRLDFPDRLVALAGHAGMPLSRLVLEVTESRLETDLGTCLDILTRLRLKGLALSIDDFGTGYSSLEHLRRMPFVELKVDQAFVHGAYRDTTARAILEASIALARQLNMTVTAEGVEDQNDLDLVTELGCDMAQGYFIARPMDAEAFAVWIEGYGLRQFKNN